ncbi:outer membrane beta-barrel protein [Photobacterium swingsii]|uniref:outer membrane beta-barrel protein n=1 Tax=Photobacterium swingsii TaxID=680026 RepID=UPI0040681EF4
MTKTIRIIFVALLFSSYSAHASVYLGSKLGLSTIDYNQELDSGNTNEDPLMVSDVYGGFGIDVGWVSDTNQYRIFYTFEQHDTETELYNDDNRLMMKTTDSISQHLISAEYLFLSQRHWNPYAGIHAGFHQRETVDSQNDFYSFTSSGFTYGAQTGITGRIGKHFTLDFGMRFSLLQSTAKNKKEHSRDILKITNNMLTVVYFGANYRF